MSSHSYQVVGGIASTGDIGQSLLVTEAPDLVILGTLSADEAVSAASTIRKLWPETKIILLFDRASPADFQKLLASEIDGCIPLFASPETLIGALQQIISSDLRVLVLRTETSAIPRAAGWQQEAESISLAPRSPLPDASPDCDVIERTASLRIFHGLSQREGEILRGVVKGHSNKMIARTCGVTDATIKVHMKSILRKIGVANRTQAAIWALEKGYGTEADGRCVEHGPQNGWAAA